MLRQYLRRDGAIRHCSLTISREFDAEGRLIRTLTLLQDVSGERVAEASKARHLRA